MSEFQSVDLMVEACGLLLGKIQTHASQLTEGGKKQDDYQVLTRKLANLATRTEAAKELNEFTAIVVNQQAGANEKARLINSIFAAEVVREFANEAEQSFADFGLSDEDLASTIDQPAIRQAVREALKESNYRRVGELTLQAAENNGWIRAESGDGSMEAESRETTRRFAREVVAPKAEQIHREDLLIPEEFIEQMGELGFFGMSIPAEYGGIGMDNLTMILVTEELSAASLPAAGSLITRPEVLAKALLAGGTEEQKKQWLEPIAHGKIMVAVSVTEPGVGSDVASVSCRATETVLNGKKGYLINGAKAWCTFAGRANVLALLARTDPDPASGHRGLSVFVVEKERFDGHDFETTQAEGGKITGQAIPTVGYRGMHSYVLQYEDYFVPAENLVGLEAGKGKGFYYQMSGFSAGRLQTAGRATGLGQASIETTARYVQERPQFGKALSEYQNTQFELGWMNVQVEAGRQLTYAAARSMDRGDANASLKASMAKLFSCRAAVNVSQKGQLMHGGWGYGEEYDISRYVCDALVLPIFEGVEPILELKVIGRALLAK